MAGGYFSLVAPWVGGVGAKPPRAGYRSLLAPWLGGAYASAGVVIPPQPPSTGGGGVRPFRIRLPRISDEDDEEVVLMAALATILTFYGRRQ